MTISPKKDIVLVGNDLFVYDFKQKSPNTRISKIQAVATRAARKFLVENGVHVLRWKIVRGPTGYVGRGHYLTVYRLRFAK